MLMMKYKNFVLCSQRFSFHIVLYITIYALKNIKDYPLMSFSCIKLLKHLHARMHAHMICAQLLYFITSINSPRRQGYPFISLGCIKFLKHLCTRARARNTHKARENDGRRFGRPLDLPSFTVTMTCCFESDYSQ